MSTTLSSHNPIKSPSISDENCLTNVSVNLRALESTVKSLGVFQVTSEDNRVAWALKAMTLTDLTTLSGDDCQSNVERLCIRAAFPFGKHSISDNNDEFMKQLHVAAVCVYPSKVKNAHDSLKKLGMLDRIQIASG
jgi:deoxyribose-phosphate aldolase